MASKVSVGEKYVLPMAMLFQFLLGNPLVCIFMSRT